MFFFKPAGQCDIGFRLASVVDSRKCEHMVGKFSLSVVVKQKQECIL